MHISAVVSNAAMSTENRQLFVVLISDLLAMYPEVGLLGHINLSNASLEMTL